MDAVCRENLDSHVPGSAYSADQPLIDGQVCEDIVEDLPQPLLRDSMKGFWNQYKLVKKDWIWNMEWTHCLPLFNS